MKPGYTLTFVLKLRVKFTEIPLIQMYRIYTTTLRKTILIQPGMQCRLTPCKHIAGHVVCTHRHQRRTRPTLDTMASGDHILTVLGVETRSIQQLQ